MGIVMKKIAIILSVVFAACVMTSCQKPFEPTISLALNNFELSLPKTTGVLSGNIHYIQITSTGPWEATLETAREGEIWCWLQDYYGVPKKDENGVTMKDEFDNTIMDRVYVAEGVEIFVGGSEEQFCKVKGTGTVFLPMGYMDNNGGSLRYATFSVRRTDTGETRSMSISQAK